MLFSGSFPGQGAGFAHNVPRGADVLGQHRTIKAAALCGNFVP